MRPRFAFTLLELLLTLAVLSVIFAVTIPQISTLLGDRRLMRGASQLQVEMTRLRVDAMRNGQVMMLEGQLGGSSLRIRPYNSLTDATEAIDQTGSQSALLSGADQAAMTIMTDDSESERTIELPDEVTLESIGVVSAARASQIEQETLGDQTEGWSRPILFYADGTTSTAAIAIVHPKVGRMTIKLRGITGDASVGEVMAVQ